MPVYSREQFGLVEQSEYDQIIEFPTLGINYLGQRRRGRPALVAGQDQEGAQNVVQVPDAAEQAEDEGEQAQQPDNQQDDSDSGGSEINDQDGAQ